MSGGLTSAMKKIRHAGENRMTRDYRHVTLTEHECRGVLAELTAERERADRAEAELIRARLQIARYAEAWSELGERIQEAKLDLDGIKDKPIPAAREGRG